MTTRHKHAYVLNVMSDDHPGIVAAVCSAVQALEGNIDSCSQTVLRGYFTLIMIVSFPRPVDPEALSRKVSKQDGGSSAFQVMVRPLESCTPEDRTSESERFVITAFGTDRPGIVRQFSQYLAGKDINIVDLYGDLSGTEFVLISQVEIPKHWDLAMLRADLEEMGRELGFTVRLQHENIFVATNQLRLKR